MERVTKIESYRVDKICAKCSSVIECTGKGVTQWDTSWEHKCFGCGEIEWITNKSYPVTEYRDIGKPKLRDEK